MGFFVVQWKEEGSVSVMSGKDVLGSGKEGETVDVITRDKGKAVLFIATILKIFGKSEIHIIKSIN